MKGKVYRVGDEEKPLSAWAKAMGLPVSIVRSRLRRGWTLEELVEAQKNLDDVVTYRGESLSVATWFRRLGLDPSVLRKRLTDGATVKTRLLIPRLRHTTHPHARKVAIGGSSKTIAEWAKEKGVNKRQLRRRLDSGWLPEFAVEVK